jgi:1-deoxy-D-xylulose-5-phosphate synthase
VVNMRYVKPMDLELVLEMAATHDLLITIEENATIGGAGSEVARILENGGGQARLLRMGLPDQFIEHGDQSQLLARLGLDKAGIVARARAAILE